MPMARPRYARLITLGALMLGAASVATAEQAPAMSPQGMVIYRDPATGQLGQPPPGTVVAPFSRATTPTPRVRQGTTSGGGVLIDGLPWNSLDATADGTGKVTTHCQSGARGEGDQP